MKKRLRKKKRLGEFTEYGVCLWVRVKSWTKSDADFDFFEKFTIFLKSLELYCGGAFGETWDLFITAEDRLSVTEQYIKAIGEWLKNQPEILRCEFSQLVDAWNGELIEYNELEDRWETKEW